MPILATVILDSGCFLDVHGSRRAFTKIGYCGPRIRASDLAVKADGRDAGYCEPTNPGRQFEIEVRHVKADGTIKKNGVSGVKDFREKFLHPLDPAKFDYILRFDSGLFAPVLVKPRHFKKLGVQVRGEFDISPDERKPVDGPVMHNIYVHFKLKNGEALEFARGGEVFWSSRNVDAKERLDIEIVADSTRAKKFCHGVFKAPENVSYWLPNQGDPPSLCSQPPCNPGSLKVTPSERKPDGVLLFPHIDIAEIKEIGSLPIEQVDARLQEMGLNPNEPLPERLLRFVALQEGVDNTRYDEDNIAAEMTFKKVSIHIHKDWSGIEAMPQIFIEVHGNLA